MTEVAPPDSSTSRDFVGREGEMASLGAALEQARTGRGCLYLVGGEPGIGKSRLADEFADYARGQGARVLWGRSWEDAGAPAYWPWIQILRTHLRSTDPTTACRQLGSGAADVAQILPEVAALVPNLPPPPPESDSARFQLFDSTTTFVRNLAAEQEVVLVLDDLHAADTPSILLLRFVARQLSDMRALVIATYRDVELTPDHPLTLALTDVAREPSTRTMALKGLREEAIGPLIRAAEGIVASARLVRGLWRETNGNPLFVRETVRLLSSEGRLRDDAPELRRVSLPAGVREAIRGRLLQLDPKVLQALNYGAVIGPEFSGDLVRTVGEYAGSAHLELLGEAVRGGLLVQPSAGRFRFPHDLIRETLYAEVDPVERVRLHRRIAEALEEHDVRAGVVSAAELAHHYYEAAQGGVDDADAGHVGQRARDYARRAAEQASRSLAYEEAARFYGMAFALAGTADGYLRERTDLLIAMGDVQARAGDLASARPSFLEAASLARRSGSAEQLARAALGYGGRFVWARAGDDRRIVPLLQDALVMLGGSNDRLRVRLLSRLACTWRGSSEHFEQSAALSEQAVALARNMDDAATLCYALVGRYGAIYWPDTVDSRYEIATEMLAVAQDAGDTERMIDALTILSFTHADLCRMTEARAEMDNLTRLAQELRQPAQLWLASAARTSYALLAGELDDAALLIEVESPPGYPTTPIRDDVSARRMHAYLLARELGRPGVAEPDVRRAVEDFPWYPAHRAALVHVLLDMNRRNEARAIFKELSSNEFAAFVRDNEWLFGMSLMAEACHRLADVAAASTAYEQLAPFAGLHAIAHAEGSAGAVDRYLGLAAVTVDRLDDAERHLTDAVRINEQMGAWPWAAHARADLADLLRRRAAAGDLARAAAEQRAAAEEADRLGMTALAQRLAAHTPAVVEHSGPGTRATLGLFRREGEYWTIGYGDDSFRLRDSKGLHYLARLLAEPGREFLALDLARNSPPAAGPSRSAPADDLGSISAGDRGGPALDEQAKRAYRERLSELQAELDEAEEWHDHERAERARSEMEFIARELSGAVGLGGRDRQSGSASERARLSVTRAMRSAMTRIAEHSTLLGDHLEATIHTGTYCAYRPDPRTPVRWQTSGPRQSR
jgi:hypothetical protein